MQWLHVLGLARHGAGMATDAHRPVDDEAELQATPSLPDRLRLPAETRGGAEHHRRILRIARSESVGAQMAAGSPANFRCPTGGPLQAAPEQMSVL